MHHHGFHYSENERRSRQNPEAILKSAGLKPGMCFIDSGCNDGFFTLPAARIVGEAGKVFAIDIDKEALDRMKQKLTSENIDNVEIIHQPSEEVMLGENIADIVFFGIVLHDFSDPLLVLKNSKQMLKPGGYIFNLDWQKKRSLYGPPYEKRFSHDHVRQLADRSGLNASGYKEIGEDYYTVVLS